MKISFRYKDVRVSHNDVAAVIKRPIVPVTLSHGEKSIDIEAYLDSGSDFMLITREIAEFLGLSLGKSVDEAGICGEQCKTVQSRVNVKITDGKETVRLLDVPVEVIIEGGRELEEMLIGRIPFFSEFDVSFKENSNRIELFRTKRK